MSVRLMSAVFESETLGATERLIMLALADHADDEGRCYPSIERLCRRTGLKERAVQNNIRKLQESGYLGIKERAGRNGSNLYFVRPDPAPDAPPHEMHPASDTETPRTKCGSDPAPDAPKPSVTIIEPSLPPKPPTPGKERLPEGWVLSEAGMNFALSKKLTHDEIEELADEFHAYWTDRTDRGARKSERGWEQTWRNRVNDRLSTILRNRRVSQQAHSGGYGQDGSLSGVLAQRRLGGQN